MPWYAVVVHVVLGLDFDLDVEGSGVSLLHTFCLISNMTMQAIRFLVEIL